MKWMSGGICLLVLGCIPTIAHAQTFTTMSAGTGLNGASGYSANDTLNSVLSGRESLPNAYTNMVTQGGGLNGQANGQGAQKQKANPPQRKTMASLDPAVPAEKKVSVAGAWSKSGKATALDALTLSLGGQTVVLRDVKAPGLKAQCKNGENGYVWLCGQSARDYLEGLLALGPVSCSGTGTRGTCRTYDGSDLAGQLVEAGWAYNNSGAYAQMTRSAMRSRAGIWIGIIAHD